MLSQQEQDRLNQGSIDTAKRNNAITSDLLKPNTPFQLPIFSNDLNSLSYNSAIPNPTIPSIESIVTPTETPAEIQQKNYLQKIADMIGINKTKAELQPEADKAVGLPALTTTLNDLNTQLEGLNNQSLALQNEVNVIPLQVEKQFEGTGATRGGVAPITTAKLRDVAIKQAAIASSQLTLKSAMYGALGKYNIAKDAADKAVEAQYEAQEREIARAKANLDAIAPRLNAEQQARATIQKAQLDERQSKIDQAKEDKKTIIAMATAALKLYPNDPQAQYAAQQALAESNKQQPNLQTVLSLVGQYQQDPQDVASKIADIEYKRSQTSKNYADMAKTVAETQASKVSTTPQGIQDQLKFLKDTASEAKKLVGSAGPSAFTRTVGDTLIGNTKFRQLEAFTNTLKTNVLTLATDPNIKKFFGPQMSNADVLLMNSAGTTLNPQANTPEQMKKEIERLETLFNKLSNVAQNQIQTGTLPNGIRVTKNADGSITDAQGNKYDSNGNKIK